MSLIRRQVLQCAAALGGATALALRHASAAPQRLAAGPCVRMPLAPGGLLVSQAGGQASGVLLSLAEALQRRLGCAVRTDLMPQQRLIQSFYQTFEADLLIPGSAATYEGHEPHFVPLFKVQAHWVGAAAHTPAQAETAGLLREGARCVLPRFVTFGAAFDAWVEQLEREGRVSWVRDVGTALRMVAVGRVAFTVASPTAVHAYGGEALYRRLRFLSLPGIPAWPAGAAVSRRSIPEDLQLRLVSALLALVREGVVAQAFRRHFPADVLALDPP